MIFGPLLVAAVVLIGLLFSPFKISRINSTIENQAATSLSPNILKGDAVKKAALKDNYFVPFFGSSEFSRFDLTHPSVIAEKYNWDFRPFLMGAAGTQSLTHYFQMQGINHQLAHKKAVFVISPQWFVKKGTDPKAFAFYYSQLQAVNFLQNQTGTPADQYAAGRLLDMLNSNKDDHSQVAQKLEKIANGDRLSKNDQTYLSFYKRMLDHEDTLFSDLNLKENNLKKIEEQKRALPTSESHSLIRQAIIRQAKLQTSGNDFGIKNSFYDGRLKSRIKSFKGTQKHFNYTKSPEFADFQLVLNQFAKDHTDVMFVIPPVNEKWSSYVGLPQGMLDGFNQKIKYQLKSQGFNHILDMSHEGAKRYFMQDTIHLGWNGWYMFDQKVKSFIDQDQAKPTYKINEQFYDREWQTLNPSKLSSYIENNN
jgi:D-alanine transfer protein